MNPQTVQLILKLLDLVMVAAKVAPNIQQQYEETRTKLDEMVATGRDPSEEELRELNTDIEKMRTELQNDLD